jgi:hypothetical protein
LVHVVAPPALYVPAPQSTTVPFVAPADGHAKPALQLLQLVAPTTLNVPAAHIAADGVAVVEPDGHA